MITECSRSTECHFERWVSWRKRAFVERCRPSDLAHLVNKNRNVKRFIMRGAMVRIIKLRPLLKKIAPSTKIEVYISRRRLRAVTVPAMIVSAVS